MFLSEWLVILFAGLKPSNPLHCSATWLERTLWTHASEYRVTTCKFN